MTDDPENPYGTDFEVDISHNRLDAQLIAQMKEWQRQPGKSMEPAGPPTGLSAQMVGLTTKSKPTG